MVKLVERKEGSDLRHSLLKRAAELRLAGSAEHLAARAACLLLSDLYQQGWTIELRGDDVWVTPPVASTAGGERPETVKDRLREYHRAARARQLEDPAVRAFISKMESRRAFNGRRVNVLDLVDDGHALAVALAEAAKAPPSERGLQLRELVRPVIQIVESGERCSVTGLDLVDVWRYFRHTWSLEYRPTPGRTMMFLIRNAARPNMPVMAIGALANATLQLRVRDDWVGWTPRALAARLGLEPSFWTQLREALLRTLDDAAEHVRADDLRASVGKVKGDALEERLLAISAAALEQRKKELKDRAARAARGEKVDPIKRLPTTKNGAIDWKTASNASLFVAKRAKTLADVLFARRILREVVDCPVVARLTVKEDPLARAVVIAAREIRKVGLASRLLELNVCGAVPPYRDLLGGKLAALAVASAEIRDAYSQRYSSQVSEIASQTAGRAVVRNADLCVIATTSLYGLSASQYNRLKVEVSKGDVLQWHDLDVTEGYGTTHLGEDAVKALRALSDRSRDGARHVNNLFGEGTSPRLRQVRDGLDQLGLDTDGLLRHNTPRRVYALEAFPGARLALCLNKPASATLRPFSAIADAWLARWLGSRITFREALDRTALQGPESVRLDLAPPSQRQLALFERAPSISPTRQPAPRVLPMRKQSNLPLIESLYRASGACADHHDASTVRLLHIETAVDDFLRRRAPLGGAVFVTGNPGDGKTHLLRRLEPDLAAAKMDVVLDANEEADEELVRRIESTLRRKGRGIAVAINEGVLVHLLRTAGDRVWTREARRQLLNPFVYREQPAVLDAAICVLDLNLRNNLSEQVVRKALDGVLRLSGACEGCPGASCSVQFNAERLVGPASDRLVGLLDSVGRTGFHATMRDLQGFLSFVLFGEVRCADFKKGAVSRYWRNAFGAGQGPLFDAVRAVDPHLQTLPLLDDALWRGTDQAADWGAAHADLARADATLEERCDAFIDRKRRALFEHTRGAAILSAAGSPVDRALAEVLTGGRRAVTTLVRLLNRFFDRDEERTDLLHLWVSHRFDAQPSRFAAASHAIGSGDLEALVPALSGDLARAFPDFRPGHAVLCAKGQPPPEGLRVDRPLVEALVAAEQGLPSTFRRGEPEARIAAFFDRLAKRRPQETDDAIEVRLVDMDTGANLRVGVDVPGRAYLKP